MSDRQQPLELLSRRVAIIGIPGSITETCHQLTFMTRGLAAVLLPPALPTPSPWVHGY
jgi:hypothetical protein